MLARRHRHEFPLFGKQSLNLLTLVPTARRFADPHDDPAILACREKQLTLVL